MPLKMVRNRTQFSQRDLNLKKCESVSSRRVCKCNGFLSELPLHFHNCLQISFKDFCFFLLSTRSDGNNTGCLGRNEFVIILFD